MGNDKKYVCRICGNTENNIPYEVTEMMFGTGEKFFYFQCPDCESLQIAEVPENIASYYPSGYYSFNTAPFVEKLKALQSSYQFHGRGIAGKLLSRIIPGGKKTIYDFLSKELSQGGLSYESSILDVGAGNGELLNLLASLGFKRLTGIDPFMGAGTVRDNGVRLVKTSLAGLDGRYDLVMFNHSLEHICEQTETMKALQELLADDGACIVRMPLVSSYAWEHYGVNWSHIEAPRHFVIHSSKSFERLCRDNGFEITETVWDSNESQFIGSERHLEGKGLLSFPFTILYRLVHFEKIKGYRKKAAELNRQKRGDQACFILRKAVISKPCLQ